ncbi:MULTISPECIES: CzcE family metal-binding protein [Delftia]|uniref:CzcE family metal-binding protein n=1 Tax=Delftia TaxID=80865 RepID=UPI000774D2E0|nr:MULTISPECIES: CzcE family metal-binding protein [Delftia]MPT54934.1 CzcE family metal-binding protein [Delftia sp.]WAT83186.1 CzcE family metal-binding protein [Delftia acidovorans]SFB66040.1 Heavy-metal resistance protein CzcE [Delftia tsuruhatensis]
MKSTLSLAAVAMMLVTSQAWADTFPTGKSYYGSEVQSPNFRTIDLSQKKPININCGEIIKFSSNGKTFIWKADSIYHSEVPIAKFAPKGFDAQGRSMFVAPNEYEYGG